MGDSGRDPERDLRREHAAGNLPKAIWASVHFVLSEHRVLGRLVRSINISEPCVLDRHGAIADIGECSVEPRHVVDHDNHCNDWRPVHLELHRYYLLDVPASDRNGNLTLPILAKKYFSN